MSSLIALSQAERDNLLATIKFVDEPAHYRFDFGFPAANKTTIINYSQLFADTFGSTCLPNPNSLRNGDRIQFGDYRGIGTWYVLWLKRGLIANDAKLCKAVIKESKDQEQRCDPFEQEELDEGEDATEIPNPAVYPFPILVPRSSDGPHNDSLHDCYIFVHPDEDGSCAASVMSSCAPHYHRLDIGSEVMMFFDPLLTHSQSHYGRIIAQAKKSPKWATLDTFPLNYIGTFDAALGEGEELEWIPLNKTSSINVPSSYFTSSRDLLNKHFSLSLSAGIRNTRTNPKVDKKVVPIDLDDDDMDVVDQPKKPTAAVVYKPDLSQASAASVSSSSSSSAPGLSGSSYYYLHCKEARSDKFYEIRLTGLTMYVRFGRVGSNGQNTEKSFTSYDEMNAFVAKTVSEKLKKGYKHSTPPSAGSSSGVAAASSASAAPPPPSAKGTIIFDESDDEKDVKVAPTTAAAPSVPEVEDVKYYLTCTEGGSAKFYSIVTKGTALYLNYGKIGLNGINSSKTFGTAQEAVAAAEKTRQDKLAKGYDVQPFPEPVAPMTLLSSQRSSRGGGVDERVVPPSSQNPAIDEVLAEAAAASEIEDNHSSGSEYEEVTDNDDVNMQGVGAAGDDSSEEEDFRVLSSKKRLAPPPTAAAVAPPAKRTKLVKVDKAKRRAEAAAAKVDVMPTITEEPAAVAAAPTVASNSSSSNGSVGGVSASQGDATHDATYYLTCTENGSNKFYRISVVGATLNIVYGRIGTNGIASTKTIGSAAEALKTAQKAMNEKVKKGYILQNNAATSTAAAPSVVATSSGSSSSSSSSSTGIAPASPVPGLTQSSAASLTQDGSLPPPTGDLKTDLENGHKVQVQGSSKVPYVLKKFHGGYSCTCLGWSTHIHIRGIQASTCKHLKLVRGEEAEAERCSLSAGITNRKGKKVTSIVSKVSLAQAWKNTINPTGYAMSEKLDGMRAYWTGKQLYTRNGLPIVTPDWFVAALPADLELDGEVFLGRKMFDECMSITRRTDGSGEWHKITYVIFDAPTIKGGIMTRLDAAKAALEKSRQAGIALYAVVHPHEACRGVEHLMEELTRVEQLGGEGLMLRHPNAFHRGGRSSDLLKVKSFFDDEAMIIGYEEGKGKHTGLIGALVCVMRNGACFKAGTGLSDKQRHHEHAPKVGTVITVKYFELTKDGIPRFPVFLRVRPDVSPDEFPKAPTIVG